MLKDGEWTKITPEIWEYLKNDVKVEGILNGNLAVLGIDEGEDHMYMVDFVQHSCGGYSFVDRCDRCCLYDETGNVDNWIKVNAGDPEWIDAELERLSQLPGAVLWKKQIDADSYAWFCHEEFVYRFEKCYECGKIMDMNHTLNHHIAGEGMAYFCCQEHKDKYLIEKLDGVETAYGDVYSLDYIANWMDDDIREEVHLEIAEVSPTPKDNQNFYDRYCELHLKKFGEVFIFEKKNPQI